MFLIIALLVSLVFIGYGFMVFAMVMQWRNIKCFDQAVAEIRFTTSVSIIVAVRNETENITHLLDALVAQIYPISLFEVLIIDDYSDDNTVNLVADYVEKNKLANIKIATLSDVNLAHQNKKAAINEGIKLANGELIITTDADCTMEPNWLATLVEYYQTYKPNLIVAPVTLSGKSILECLQSVEFLSIMLFTGASINNKKPLMCNGANLAYPKAAFNEVNGFEGNLNNASGDDTFLMFKIWKRNKLSIHFLKSAEAIVQTKAQTTFAALINQRIRWASKTKSYHLNHVSLIGFLIIAANLSVLFLAIICLFNLSYFLMLISALLFKLIADIVLLISSNAFFKSKQLRPFNIGLLTIVYPFYLLLIMLLQSRGFKWKGRNFKS